MEFTGHDKRAAELVWADITATTDFGPLPDSTLESWLRQYPAVVVIASIGAASHATKEFNDEIRRHKLDVMTITALFARCRFC